MEYAQRRKLQSEATARRILHTALELMRSQGFDQVSVRDICKAAGITTGAFYHHFPSKDALLEYGFAPLDDSVAAAMAGHEAEPPERRLWRLLSAYAEFMEDSRELIGRYYQRRIAVPGTKSMDSRRYIHQAMLDCFRQAGRGDRLGPAPLQLPPPPPDAGGLPALHRPVSHLTPLPRMGDFTLPFPGER